MPFSKMTRIAADGARPGKAAEQPRRTAMKRQTADGAASMQTSSAKLMPASAAVHEDDLDSDEDAALPAVRESSRAEQPFLDEVLRASRESGAQERNGRAGKQRHEDRSGVVEVVTAKRTRPSGRPKLKPGKGVQPQAKAVAAQPGQEAVRGSSAARLLASNDLRAAIATGAVASAWD